MMARGVCDDASIAAQGGLHGALGHQTLIFGDLRYMFLPVRPHKRDPFVLTWCVNPGCCARSARWIQSACLSPLISTLISSLLTQLFDRHHHHNQEKGCFSGQCACTVALQLSVLSGRETAGQSKQKTISVLSSNLLKRGTMSPPRGHCRVEVISHRPWSRG